MAMLPKVEHVQARVNLDLLRVGDWSRRKCADFRGDIQRQMDAHTHSHTMVADHTKG